MQLRLDGATMSQIRTYAQTVDPETGRPWHVKDCTLWDYVRRADKIMTEFRQENRERLINLHLGMRQRLYAKALDQGALETALACIKDSARLQGLYPHEDGANGIGQGARQSSQVTNILVDLRTMLPADREKAITSGCVVDLAQLSELTTDELIRLTTAAQRVIPCQAIANATS